MLTGLFGQGIGQALGSYNHLGNLGASACQAQNAYPTYYQQAQAQQMAHAHAQQAYQPIKWMFNGKSMAFKEFVDIMFPEDTAEKTAFILKYAEE